MLTEFHHFVQFGAYRPPIGFQGLHPGKLLRLEERLVADRRLPAYKIIHRP